MINEEQAVYCPNCGQKNEEQASFCTNCGSELPSLSAQDSQEVASNEQPAENGEATTIFDMATKQINGWTGGQGAIKVSLKDFFGQVFRRHTEDEAEKIFIVGTKETTLH